MVLILSGRWFLHVVTLLAALAPVIHAFKYFDEPRGKDLHHYDARYFRGKVAPAKRAETLSELIVAFLDIMESEGIVAWLAHGTLMGWYWNGHPLPWDLDVDMQIDVMSLQTLAEEYNGTVWTAVPEVEGGSGEPRDYLLDVNPYWLERVHGDGANFIDARFIDTRNGLYVDITALTELDPVNLPNIVTCKNYHNYRLEDIYPLRETQFEGTTAKVPFNYKTILQDEYGLRSIVLAIYNGYVWSKEDGEWLPKAQIKRPLRINGLPSTPPTRIIPEEELPYFDSPVMADEPKLPKPSNVPLDDRLAQTPNPPTSSSYSIEIEELPADRIDTPQVGGSGNIISTFWEYLTLFWRN